MAFLELIAEGDKLKYRMGDWNIRLGGVVHVDSIMDRILHNKIWIKMGSMNIRKCDVKK